jgi:Zn-dependent peptidase ImmA (M78 family)
MLHGGGHKIMDKKQRAKLICDIDSVIRQIDQIRKEVPMMTKMMDYTGHAYLAREYGVSIEVIRYYRKKYKTLPSVYYTNEKEMTKTRDMLKMMEREMKLRRLKRKSSFFGRLFRLK